MLTSMLFLLLVSSLYKSRILDAHEGASLTVNHLLQAALENAMIKRDLEGLQDIVTRLGAQDSVSGVMIADPQGEIRFSSYPDTLYQTLEDTDFAAAVASGSKQTGFRVLDGGQEVLRSINPVPNQERCFGCHGSIEDHPINGLLIVDYDSSDTRVTVMRGALLLAALGFVVLLLLEAGLWFALRTFVLSRIKQLATTTQALAAGDLSIRTTDPGDDEIAGLAAHFNDMADRIQANLDEIHAARNSLQSLIDAIPDGVRVIDPDFGVVMANTAYCQQIGAAQKDVVGQFCYTSSHKRSSACVPTLVNCPVVVILQQGQPDLTCTHEHIDCDGAQLSVEVSAAAVTLNIDGEDRRCVVESIRDMESDLSISQKQRLAEMGNLAAGVAHEVHNPLSSISLALKSIKAQADLPDDLQKYLDIAETEIGNCQAITESLLRLSALPQTERELVDIKRVISDTTSLLRFEAEQTGAVIEQNVLGTPRVLARDSDIRNLVFNLALNAIHAMPKGGVLTLSCHQSDQWVRLEVADTGVGIPERDQAKILLPFWTRRADGSHGRGLGLAICSSILKALGGRLSFTSQVGKGTCFTIDLPKFDERSE